VIITVTRIILLLMMMAVVRPLIWCHNVVESLQGSQQASRYYMVYSLSSVRLQAYYAGDLTSLRDLVTGLRIFILHYTNVLIFLFTKQHNDLVWFVVEDKLFNFFKLTDAVLHQI